MWRPLTMLLNNDFEENAPQQAGVISECYERPRKEMPADVSWTANSGRWSKYGTEISILTSRLRQGIENHS